MSAIGLYQSAKCQLASAAQAGVCNESLQFATQNGRLEAVDSPGLGNYVPYVGFGPGIPAETVGNVDFAQQSAQYCDHAAGEGRQVIAALQCKRQAPRASVLGNLHQAASHARIAFERQVQPGQRV